MCSAGHANALANALSLQLLMLGSCPIQQRYHSHNQLLGQRIRACCQLPSTLCCTWVRAATGSVLTGALERVGLRSARYVISATHQHRSNLRGHVLITNSVLERQRSSGLQNHQHHTGSLRARTWQSHDEIVRYVQNHAPKRNVWLVGRCAVPGHESACSCPDLWQYPASAQLFRSTASHFLLN